MYIKSKGLDAKEVCVIREDNKNLRKKKSELENELSLAVHDRDFFKGKVAKLQEEINEVKSLENDNTAEVVEKIKCQLLELENENKELKSQNVELNSRNSEMEKHLVTRQNENRKYGVLLQIPYGEKNLFPDEIEDYFYKIFYATIKNELKNCPTNKEDERYRKRDVLEDVLSKMEFDWEKSETAKKIQRIERILKASRDPSPQTLSHEGFSNFSYDGEHMKCYFYEKRYQTVFSCTSSDKRSNDNKMTEIKGRFFL